MPWCRLAASRWCIHRGRTTLIRQSSPLMNCAEYRSKCVPRNATECWNPQNNMVNSQKNGKNVESFVGKKQNFSLRGCWFPWLFHHDSARLVEMVELVETWIFHYSFAAQSRDIDVFRHLPHNIMLTAKWHSANCPANCHQSSKQISSANSFNPYLWIMSRHVVAGLSWLFYKIQQNTIVVKIKRENLFLQDKKT